MISTSPVEIDPERECQIYFPPDKRNFGLWRTSLWYREARQRLTKLLISGSIIQRIFLCVFNIYHVVSRLKIFKRLVEIGRWFGPLCLHWFYLFKEFINLKWSYHPLFSVIYLFVLFICSSKFYHYSWYIFYIVPLPISHLVPSVKSLILIFSKTTPLWNRLLAYLSVNWYISSTRPLKVGFIYLSTPTSVSVLGLVCTGISVFILWLKTRLTLSWGYLWKFILSLY